MKLTKEDRLIAELLCQRAVCRCMWIFKTIGHDRTKAVGHKCAVPCKELDRAVHILNAG